MDARISILRGACALGFGAAVASCGGGGGGGEAAPPAQELQLNPLQMTFGAPANGGPPQPQTLSGTVTGSPAAVYAFVEITTAGIAGYITPQIVGDSVSSAIHMKAAGLLQPGTYRDTITVRACPDSTCTKQFAGSPATVNVTYTVGLDVSPAALSAQAVEGTVPAAQNVVLRYYAGNGTWSTAAAYSSGSGWLAAPTSGASLPATIPVTFLGRPAGTYAATLDITAAGATNQTRTVPVSYVVEPLLRASAIADFSVTNQQSAGGQTRSVSITTADPARNTAWSATVDLDADWLALMPAAGSTNGVSNLVASVVEAEVAQLRNGRYAATIAVDPALEGATTIDLPVVLDLDRTHVATVAPYVAADNMSADVIIRGTRFTDVVIENVRFGGVDAVGFSIDGATRIRARHPPLPAGRYPVTIVVAGAPASSSAELVVQAPFSYAAAGAVNAPIPFATIAEFDAERRACYVASTIDPNPARIGAAFATTSWSTIMSPGTYGPFIRGMVLSADGRELLVALDDEVVHLDPATLIETHRTRIATPAWPYNTLAGIARVDDGTIAVGLATELRAYRPWNYTDAQIMPIDVAGNIDANRTGNQLVWTSQSVGTSYRVIDSTTFATSFQYSGGPHLLTHASDRFGLRWAFTRLSNTDGTDITDGQGVLLEQIPGAGNSNALSADGNLLALGFHSEYRFFDLTPVGGGGAAIDLGAVPISPLGALYNLHFTPHQDEVVSCGRGTIQAAVVP